MAADICPERYGSSPEPSETRPQRGSAETSHIGENVHAIPNADASAAEILATVSAAFGSQEHDIPRFSGKPVLAPCMMSCPKRIGIPRRELSTASLCNSMISSGFQTFRSEPHLPSFITRFTSTGLPSGPVTTEFVGTNWFNCPIFSARVILDMSSSTLASLTFFSLHPAHSVSASAAAIISDFFI